MRSNRLFATTVSGVLALTLSFGLGACSSSQEETKAEDKAEKTEQVEEKEPEPEPEPVDERQVLGVEEEGATEIALTNSLGNSLGSVCIRKSGGEAYGENLLADGASIAEGEQVRLFIAADSAAAEETEEATEGEEAAEGEEVAAPTYDILVSLAVDDSDPVDVEFLNVPVDAVSEMTLRQDDEVAFVDYKKAEGEEGSTRDDALARKAEQEAQVQEESNYEEPAYDYYEEPSYQETYTEPSYSEPSYTPPVEAPAAPTQNVDACEGGVALRY